MSKPFRFSSLQREVLRSEMSANAYPDYTRVAQRVGENRQRVLKWFQNNRRNQGINNPPNRFKVSQVTVLRQEADKGDRPKKHRIARIAARLGETRKRIQQWFEDERKRRGTTNKNYYFMAEQVLKMRCVFQADRYPKYERVALEVRDTTKRVQTWFAHQRAHFGILFKQDGGSKKKKKTKKKKKKRDRKFTARQQAVMRRLVSALPFLHMLLTSLKQDFLHERLGISLRPEVHAKLEKWWDKQRRELGVGEHYRRDRFPLWQTRGLRDLYLRRQKPSKRVRRLASIKLRLTDRQIYQWCYD